jgi:2'-5' RNA ligase
MPEQFSLFGGEATLFVPPRRPGRARPQPAHGRVKHSLFLALFPSESDAALLAEAGARLRRELGMTGRAVAAGRLHVSLHYLGGYADALPQALVDAARHAAGAVSPMSLDVAFDRAVTFNSRTPSRRPKPFVLSCSDAMPQVEALRRRLGLAMADAGLSVIQSFTPHMTLAYEPVAAAEQAVEPVRWSATAFTLVHSHVGEGVHEIVDRWPLGR